MNLPLSWVDFIILGVLILFVVEALRRSLILETLDFISFLLAALLAFSYYNLPAAFFETQFRIPHGLSLVLGFMAAWFLVETVFFLLIRLFLPKVLSVRLPNFEKLAVIPAFLRGLTIVAIGLVIIGTFPIQPQIKIGVLDSEIGSRILKYAYGLESPVKQVFGGVVNDSLTFLTIRPKTDERVNLGFQTSQISVDGASEKIMFDLVNQERVSRGLKALVLDPALRNIGRSHSEDMLKRGYFSHYSQQGKTVADRALEGGVDFIVVGENLAYAPSVELAHKGLMNSEGHRANILSSDYGKLGIGAIDGGVYGKMFTQVFTD